MVLAELMNMAFFGIDMQSYVALVALHFASSATFMFCADHHPSFCLISLIVTMVNMAGVTGMGCSFSRGRMMWRK